MIFIIWDFDLKSKIIVTFFSFYFTETCLADTKLIFLSNNDVKIQNYL